MKFKPGKEILASEGAERDADKLDVFVKRNTEKKWEAHVINFGWQKTTGTMDKFEAKNGRELISNILPEVENTYTVYHLKKDGFAINNTNQMNHDGDEWYYILPACKESFHRDWEHDGICVHDLKKEY